MIEEIHKGCGGVVKTIHYADMRCTTKSTCLKCGKEKVSSLDSYINLVEVEL